MNSRTLNGLPSSRFYRTSRVTFPVLTTGVLNGIFWVLRSGALCRDLPLSYVINPTDDQKWTHQVCQVGYSGGPLIPSAVLDADGTIYVGSIEVGPMYKLLAIGHDGPVALDLWSGRLERVVESPAPPSTE
jgi:hypothetical protein